MIMISALAEPVAAISSTEQATTILDLLMKGGIIMIPIVLLSIISFYIFIERIVYIRRSASIQQGLVTAISNEVLNGNPKNALLHARNNQSAIGRILESGIEKLGKPQGEVERNIETTTNLEITKMEKNTGYLGIIASVAPMLGFIGTIAGVIKIFYNISLADNISIGIIAGGLYQKMICSGAGLIVGVLAYAAYHYIQMRIDRYLIKLQESLIQFLKVL
ncbi:MAG TPA: biopolymer transporter ExbB [Bacteroidales bacterium]|nr:biopolymer transporter ExbB [Bacteroidales bacterium]